MRHSFFRLFVASLVLNLVACNDPAGISDLKNEIVAMKQQQATLLEKINSIDASLKNNRPAAQPAPPAPPVPQGPFTVSKQNSNILGNPKAPTVIVAWSDFQCPFCSKLLPVVNDTLKDPEVKGKVAFVFKQYPLPFHNKATPAAKAALAAGKQGKFFEMHDKIFANQGQLAEDKFEGWAKEIGINVTKFKKDMQDPALDDVIKSDMEEGNKFGVRGTPSVFIGTNDKDSFTVSRAQGRSPDAFKQAIKDLLAKKPA